MANPLLAELLNDKLDKLQKAWLFTNDHDQRERLWSEARAIELVREHIHARARAIELGNE